MINLCPAWWPERMVGERDKKEPTTFIWLTGHRTNPGGALPTSPPPEKMNLFPPSHWFPASCAHEECLAQLLPFPAEAREDFSTQLKPCCAHLPPQGHRWQSWIRDTCDVSPRETAQESHRRVLKAKTCPFPGSREMIKLKFTNWKEKPQTLIIRSRANHIALVSHMRVTVIVSSHSSSEEMPSVQLHPGQGWFSPPAPSTSWALGARVAQGCPVLMDNGDPQWIPHHPMWSRDFAPSTPSPLILWDLYPQCLLLPTPSQPLGYYLVRSTESDSALSLM